MKLNTIGSYTVVSGPFEGGLGRVYKAVRWDQPNHFFAVKVPKDLRNPDHVNALRREGKVLSRVQHRNLIQLYEDNSELNPPHVVLQFLANGSLRDHVGRIPAAGVAVTLYQVAGALGALHDAGGFHRDVKPDNILVAGDGSTVLADANLANVPTSGSGLTRSVAGTPGYIDPWVVNSQYDTAADIYSLGVTAAELLTGWAPSTLVSPNGLSLQPHQIPADTTQVQVALHRLISWMVQPARHLRPTARVVEQWAWGLIATPAPVPQPAGHPATAHQAAPNNDEMAGILAAGAVLALGLGLVFILSKE